ncbi:MAG: TolC family protein, partial [Thermoanaerobaculia bacterium]
LDLARAVETTLRANPGLLAVEEVRSQVTGGVREARADAYPQLSFVSSWGESRNPSFLNSPDFEEILNQFPGGGFEPSRQELSRAVIEVKQPVWTFGKIRAAVDLAKTVGEAVEAQIGTARLDAAFATAEAYYNVQAAREGLATIESEREFRGRDLARIEDLLEIGETTQLEQLRAFAALAAVDPEVARRQGEVTVAEMRLRQLLALAADEPLELEPSPGELPAAPAMAPLLAAASARPELEDLRKQARGYELQKQITHADGLPRIDLSGYWGREVRLVDNFSDPLYNTWSAGLELSWPFFDGGRRKGQIEQFESQRRQIEIRRADLEAAIRLETDQARTNYATALSRARSAEISAQAAREAERVARATWEEGVATQTDLLDAQRSAVLASVSAIEARYEALVEASRLSRAVGLMPTESWSTLAQKELP